MELITVGIEAPKGAVERLVEIKVAPCAFVWVERTAMAAAVLVERVTLPLVSVELMTTGTSWIDGDEAVDGTGVAATKRVDTSELLCALVYITGVGTTTLGKDPRVSGCGVWFIVSGTLVWLSVRLSALFVGGLTTACVPGELVAEGATVVAGEAFSIEVGELGTSLGAVSCAAGPSDARMVLGVDMTGSELCIEGFALVERGDPASVEVEVAVRSNAVWRAWAGPTQVVGPWQDHRPNPGNRGSNTRESSQSKSIIAE